MFYEAEREEYRTGARAWWCCTRPRRLMLSLVLAGLWVLSTGINANEERREVQDAEARHEVGNADPRHEVEDAGSRHEVEDAGSRHEVEDAEPRHEVGDAESRDLSR